MIRSSLVRGLVTILLLCSVRGFADTLKFSEKFAEKLLTFSEDGDKFYEPIATGSYSFSGLFFTDDRPFMHSDFSDDTEVTIMIGNESYTFLLGDDPKYVSGLSTKVTVVLTAEQCKETKDDFVCKEVKSVTIKLAFTNKGVKISVKAKTGTDKYGTEFAYSPIAEEYAYDDAPFGGDGQVFIAIAEFERSFYIEFVGKSKVKYVTKGEEEFELGSASLKTDFFELE